ncbi:flagellar basal body protein, partial [Azospirillum sp. B506]|uniref:flagellar basal body protein n=1 Tax=Azospirillum sp. B506 TaxID=137721 RepID=UPI001FCBF590
MSLTSAMYSATSGLTAQSKALASISSNIANSSTTGFKGTQTDFTSYINKNTTVDEQVGGVIASNTRTSATRARSSPPRPPPYGR